MKQRPRSRSAAVKRPARSNQDSALITLQERLRTLEQAFNTNTKVFSDGIQMLEVQQEVLRRVAQDLQEGSPKLLVGGRIDFNAYLLQYVSELAANEEARARPVPAPTIIVADDESPTIFGGDVQ